jgi:hypothetical protein
MAKDKRHPMSTDMNDVDLSDTDAMTDKERETMQGTVSDGDQKAE